MRDERDWRRSSEFWVLSSEFWVLAQNSALLSQLFRPTQNAALSTQNFLSRPTRSARLFCGLGFFLST